jgi:hypothetical protein
MASSKHLDQSLSTLRSEIQALDIGDEEARRRLDRLVVEIEASIKNPNGAVADDRLTGGLKAAILNFEVSHPRLAVVMNDVLEKLSAMGI